MPVALEESTPQQVAEAIRAMGGRVVLSSPRRAEMERAMREHEGLLGGGPSGRLWYPGGQTHFAADALVTITLLLQLLSQSDRPLSEVLDAWQAVG